MSFWFALPDRRLFRSSWCSVFSLPLAYHQRGGRFGRCLRIPPGEIIGATHNSPRSGRVVAPGPPIFVFARLPNGGCAFTSEANDGAGAIHGSTSSKPRVLT